MDVQTGGKVQTGAELERRYLRPVDVVRQTGLSKSSVFAALWSGALEGYRARRAWLIPVEAVDQWIRGEDNDAA